MMRKLTELLIIVSIYLLAALLNIGGIIGLLLLLGIL